MDYQNVVEEFARRTRTNLELLRKLSTSEPDAYEVTALVNSMLGLLVFPQQKDMNSIAETPVDELKQLGWPIPEVVGDLL